MLVLSLLSSKAQVLSRVTAKDSLAEKDAKINCLRSHLPRLSGILVEADELDLAPISYFKYIIFPL